MTFMEFLRDPFGTKRRDLQKAVDNSAARLVEQEKERRQRAVTERVGNTSIAVKRSDSSPDITSALIAATVVDGTSYNHSNDSSSSMDSSSSSDATGCSDGGASCD